MKSMIMNNTWGHNEADDNDQCILDKLLNYFDILKIICEILPMVRGKF